MRSRTTGAAGTAGGAAAGGADTVRQAAIARQLTHAAPRLAWVIIGRGSGDSMSLAFFVCAFTAAPPHCPAAHQTQGYMPAGRMRARITRSERYVALGQGGICDESVRFTPRCLEASHAAVGCSRRRAPGPERPRRRPAALGCVRPDREGGRLS